jgi:hypothetical protein
LDGAGSKCVDASSSVGDVMRTNRTTAVGITFAYASGSVSPRQYDVDTLKAVGRNTAGSTLCLCRFSPFHIVGRIPLNMTVDFDDLRRLAARKRDLDVRERERIILLSQEAIAEAQRGIDEANSNYEKEVAQIDSLEESLAPAVTAVERIPNKREVTRPVIDLICDTLPPRGEVFDLDGIFADLKKRFPDREFNRASVRTLLHRLFKEGVILRVQKGGGSLKVAKYAVPGSDIEFGPFGDLTQIEVAEKLLRELHPKRFSAPQLAEAMLGRGYTPDSDHNQFVSSLQSAMRRKPAIFQENENGWTVKVKSK